MAGYRVISSDSHVIEPPDIWTNRIEPKYRDRAPQVIEDETGDFWYIDGKQLVTSSLTGSRSGDRFEGKLDFHESFRGDVRPGGYIPEEQIKDMDFEGIYAGMLYPSFGLALYRCVHDIELLTSIFRTYNDWLAEFCNPFLARLKGIAMINLDDVETGIKELERCAKMGLVGAMIAVYPLPDRPYSLPEYEPFWSAAQDLQMPLSLHFTTNRPVSQDEFHPINIVNLTDFTNVDHWVRMSLADLILNGVFERHPQLQVGAVEHEMSWVPHFLDRLDYNYTQRIRLPDTYRFKEDALPSDYFQRNVFLSFQEDGLAISQRDLIGVDNMMWGSDYPHPEGTFPRSREILEEILADCTEDEKAKIAGGNAARVYHLG